MSLAKYTNQREKDKFAEVDGEAAVRVTNTGESKAYKKLIREKSDDENVIYIGEAETGTATSAASWKIKKLDTTNTLDATWADGNINFDNIWDNRESLSYS